MVALLARQKTKVQNMKKFEVELKSLTNGCRLLVCRQFLSAGEMKQLRDFLDTGVKVGAEVIRGRTARRQTCSFGEFEEAPGEPMFYQYSGKMQRVGIFPSENSYTRFFLSKKQADGWPKSIKDLLDKLWTSYCEFHKQEDPKWEAPPKPNYCLVNRYPGIEAGIGSHSDAEVVRKMTGSFSSLFK